MSLLEPLKLASIQPFQARSDRLNVALRATQGLIAAGLGYEVLHVGLAAPAAWTFVAAVCVAKGIAMVGWKNEMARHVAAA